ncbi:hypothetical protein [Streptomyces sp. NBC_00334]|uniref:hypothetical protein n=1 Tax=Streptomyces sp. NBC_00334 TaxID=2975713 RepID=UPI002E2E634E|nr:hypothetical protein [Streptomyces sp. NBC_00334]
MRPAPHAPAARAARRSAWPRVLLVLLLALVVPCAHATAQAAPVVQVAASGGTAAEHDHLDTALRTPARSGRRAAAVRPAPPSPAAGRRVRRDLLPPVGPPPSPRGPRSVVLRC